MKGSQETSQKQGQEDQTTLERLGGRCASFVALPEFSWSFFCIFPSSMSLTHCRGSWILRYRRGEEAVPDHRCGQRWSPVQGGDDDFPRQVQTVHCLQFFSKGFIVLNWNSVLQSGGKCTLSPRNVEIESNNHLYEIRNTLYTCMEK